MRRPFPLYLLLALHLLLGVSALTGGWQLLTDPAALGMPPDALANAPFSSYTVPGLFLFVVQGLFPLLIVVGLWRKPDWSWAGILNIYAGRHWSWTYSLFAGLILIGWIGVQISWVPAFWLQPVFLAFGLLLVILTLWPSVMRYFEIE